MITSKTAQTPDTANWVHGCFMVRVGTDFKTYQEIMQYAEQDETYPSSSKPALEPNVAKILKGQAGQDAPLPVYFSKRKCRDSSLGGNDAINPLPQFCVDDDITHPHYVPNFGNSEGMGQVYSENYDDNQQILYLGFGIPVYNDLGNFWSSAVDPNIAEFVNKGTGITPESIGYLVGKTPVSIIKMATIPYKYIFALVDGVQKVKITKYYSFQSQMPMYFRFVNTILVMLATNMNIMGSGEDYTTTGSAVSGATSVDLNNAGTQPTEDLSGLSSIFKDAGLDMAKIMTKRFLYENGKNNSIGKAYTDQTLFDNAGLDKGDGVAAPTDPTQSTNPTANATNSTTPAGDGSATGRDWKANWVNSFVSAYKTTIYDGHLFIGFRIDKGMGATESFSNSTGESQISQLANSKFQDGRDASFGVMGGNLDDGFIKSAIDGVSGAIKGIAASFNLDSLAAAVSGSARIDIPDVWMGSNYSRSASFTISCLSPYGDMESIFLSEYVPLACLLAGTLPRGTGYASHSSPFVCQAYCRGIFSSPLCMIESLQVSRGADQFGFTANRLPLELTLNVTLKDLTPTMYMSMGGDKGIGAAIFGTDDNFGEYMLTLSGMGLQERLAPFRSIRRKTKILLSTLYKNKLSPFMLGMEGGSRFMISRVISTITSGGAGIPGN